MTTTATGTIYGLVDPRDGQTRYVGQTKRTLPARLRGHYSKPTSPRVKLWLDELLAAGLKPHPVPIREGIPAAELAAAEREEITRIMVTGGSLLNELSTAQGRELLRQRHEMERKAAEQAAWAELGGVALATLGGPLPPGDLHEVKIPVKAFSFMWKIRPGHRERIDSLLSMPPHYSDQSEECRAARHRLWNTLRREQEEATEALWHCMQGNWGELRRAGGDSIGEPMRLNALTIAEMPCTSPAQVSRRLALTVWYMAAVSPWRHLAELGGVPLDDASFIGWAGGDRGVREALEFLADMDDGMLDRLSRPWWLDYRPGPGHFLGAVAAAYSGIMPSQVVRNSITEILRELADDHQLTRPMADLLVRLDPDCVDSVFGKDVAAEMDRDLSLPPGTAGRVLREFVERGERRYIHLDPEVRRVADRSAQELPVTAVPDFAGWHGPRIPAGRIIGASLVRAGLAVPEGLSPEEYAANARALWTPTDR